MSKLFLEILKTPLLLSICFWGINSFLQVYAFYKFGDAEMPIVSDVITLLIATFVGVVQLTASNSIIFLRNVAKSSRQFWRSRFLLVLIIMVFNVLVFALKSQAYQEKIWNLIGLSLPYTFWIVFCFFIFFIGLPGKEFFRKSSEVPSWKNILFRLGGLFLAYQAFTYVIEHSVLMTFAFFVFTSWSIFIFFDVHVKELVYPEIRIKVWGVGCLVIGSLVGVSIWFFSYKFTKHSAFLGDFGPAKKAWEFSKIKEVKSPAGFLNWYSDAERPLTIDEALQMISRLTELCPLQFSDDPTVVLCLDKDRERDRAFLSQEWVEADVLKFLDVDSYYSNLVGVMAARKLPRPFSASIKNRIEKLTKIPGATSVIALATLSGIQRSRRESIVIELVSKRDGQ